MNGCRRPPGNCNLLSFLRYVTKSLRSAQKLTTRLRRWTYETTCLSVPYRCQLLSPMSLRVINSSLQQLADNLQKSYKMLPAPTTTVSAAFVVSYLLIQVFQTSKKRPSNLPPLVPYTIPFIGHGREMSKDPYAFLQRCKKQYGPVFEIYSYGKKLVVVTGKQVAHCFRVGEEYLDFHEGVHDLLPIPQIIDVSYGKMKQPVGPQYPMSKNPMIRLVRNNFKSHQLDIFQDRMVDAIERGLDKDITFKPGENSTTLNVSTFFQTVVARISAQVFAGEAYADNEPLIHAIASYTLSLFRAGMVQAVLPRAIANLIIRRYMSVGQNIDVTMKEVTPYLTELKKKEDQYGQSKPTNFMHMMLQTPAADDHMQTPEEVAFWMKDIAFASIHTTSRFLGFALHDLSDRPDIQDLLRKETNKTKEMQGKLTPETISEMPILDSFLRESFRLGGDYVGIRHKAMSDTVLQGGITIPKGTIVGLSIYDAHMDPEIQDIGSNGIPLTELDPMRFVGKRSKKSTAVGTDLLTFGVGYHSCPGRYFASQEIRYLLACIVDRYDISTTTEDGKRAPNGLNLGMVQMVPTQPIRLTLRA